MASNKRKSINHITNAFVFDLINVTTNFLHFLRTLKNILFIMIFFNSFRLLHFFEIHMDQSNNFQPTFGFIPLAVVVTVSSSDFSHFPKLIKLFYSEIEHEAQTS